MSLLDALPSRVALQLLVGSVLLLFGVNSYLNYRKVLKSINFHPGLRLFFSPRGLLGNVLPPIRGVSIGANWGMVRKYKLYADAGWDVVTYVTYPRPEVTYFLADPLAIKEVTLHRARFPKPVEDYQVLAFFGDNIVITEDDEWKKHRKIAAPAFSERNNKLVWDEGIRFTLEMFKSWGSDNAEVVIDHCLDITLPFALFIIGSAGFGQQLSWEDDTFIPPGHKMSFKDALHTVSARILIKVAVPGWAFPFLKVTRHFQTCLDELQNYMQEMIAGRRALGFKEERDDLFTALLEGNEFDDAESRLTDQELIGNIFMFLVAGHETTAHTLCFVIGLLAIEQEEQEKLYQHIISLVPRDQDATYGQMNALTYVIAVLYETLRLFPPLPYIPKISAEDTTLPVVRPDGSTGSIPVPKGTRLTINSTGLHYNPRYWPDPTAFKPSRFMEDWPKDAFLSFSAGGRACLGRRFSETESVAFITLLVRKYRIELKNPEQYKGLTLLEKRERLLKNRLVITTTPLSVPLVFKRR